MSLESSQFQTGHSKSPRDISPTSRQPPQGQYPRQQGERQPPSGTGAQRLPVRTSSVPVAREQQSSPYDREKEQRERRDREKEREYRERERERAKPKEANGPSPTAVAAQKKKQEQRISTMTEAQIMEKLRKCRQVQLDIYGSRVV